MTVPVFNVPLVNSAYSQLPCNRTIVAEAFNGCVRSFPVTSTVMLCVVMDLCLSGRGVLTTILLTEWGGRVIFWLSLTSNVPSRNLTEISSMGLVELLTSDTPIRRGPYVYAIKEENTTCSVDTVRFESRGTDDSLTTRTF